MISKYVNPFDGLDIGGIAGKIRDFITTLNNINYESSGCFMMSTNAAYDGSFNEAVTKLKTKDIQNMIDICNKCMLEVIAKIVEFNSYYDGTYTSIYDAYKAAYETFINTPEKIEKTTFSLEKGFHKVKVHNKKWDVAKNAMEIEKTKVLEQHRILDDKVTEINSVSFD